MVGSKKKGGMSSLLLGLRLAFNNPVSRVMLRAFTHLIDEGDGEKPIIYKALGAYAGVDKAGCAVSRFASLIIKGMIKAFMLLSNGDEKGAIKALRDPAIRRGITVVFEGLALYGVTVPQKLPAPFQIVWNFTNMCNLRCKHCYQRADRPLPNELSLEEKLKVIDQLDKAGVPSLALSGGEPTLHPDFLRIVSEASSRGIYMSVATNGWRFADEKFAIKAKKAGLRYVEVSVDSADPKKHDKFRGVKGAWAHAVKGLKNAVKLKFSTAMATTLTRLNVDEVDDIIELAEDIGVGRLIFFNFVPVGRGLENAEELDLDPIEREKVLWKLAREHSRRKMDIVSTAPYYGRVVLQASGGEEVSPTHFYAGSDPAVKALAEYVGGCGAGRIYCAIQPEGTVAPCVFMPIPVGNLRVRSFSYIWNNSRVMLELRDRSLLKEDGFCSRCPYKNICGGCRARAYGYFGDYLASDPGCIYNIRLWRRIIESRSKKKELMAISR